MSNIEPEAWKHGTDWQHPDGGGEGEREEWWKEGEGISLRTCMNDPWTWTTVCGWTVGVGSGLGKGGQRGGNWDNCNIISINFF